MKFKFVPVVFTAAVTSMLTFFVAAKYQDAVPFFRQEQRLPVSFAGFNASEAVRSAPPADFENAAETSVQAVVHIRTQTKPRTVTARDPFFDDNFFGNMFGQQYYIPPQAGSGSGVVFSPDGYIVTNYHVVSNADQVTVTFNDRITAQAEVVAKDASTDIAVLKVNEKNLPYMEFGNSDNVKLGQWVLAVGYPLTLDATVTAGIVSAKSRAIGINRSQSGASAIESFIQTDAAVNPGNSGGALVNTSGQLIGINSAIASPTGSYAGYSYAIPSNIVRKVVNDLMKYGSLQRAFLGIKYADPANLTPEQITKLGLDRASGVYVAEVPEDGGAYTAGIRKGDFITAINSANVGTVPQLLEQIARYQPGDNITVSYAREGRSFNTTVKLRNARGTTELLQGASAAGFVLGADVRPLTGDEKKKYHVDAGVQVTGLNDGLIARQTDIRKGFIIVGVNNNRINSSEDLQAALSNSGNAQIAGIYPGNRGMYYYSLNLNENTGEQ